MIGYKAFDEDLKCRGFQFKVGKTYSTGFKKSELELCSETVFHFCRELQCIEIESSYMLSKSRICEVIAIGDIISSKGKYGTNKIKILREIPKEEIESFVGNDGVCNIGFRNTGNRNIGCCNRGNRNIGDKNLGDENTGDFNIGNFNKGLHNMGYSNSGCHNKGSYNIGDWNMGDHNTGCWNIGNNNKGYFNTISQKTFMFNKEVKQDINISLMIFPSFLRFKTDVWIPYDEIQENGQEVPKAIKLAGGYVKKLDYKEAFRLAYEEAPKNEHHKLFDLPNFDPLVFKEISGIDATKEYKEYKNQKISKKS